MYYHDATLIVIGLQDMALQIPRASRKLAILTAVFIFSLAACQQQEQAAPTPATADLLMINGYVYTADSEQSVAEAVAVSEGEIIYVGTTQQALEFQGADTPIIDLNGRMMLPGLHDTHLHVFEIVEPDICSLGSQPLSLEEMVPLLRDCMDRYQLAPGEWMPVYSWYFALDSNQPSDRYPNLRTALDAVSTDHPIMLWGNDGHHGAANSAALALAGNSEDVQVGFSAATLAGEMAEYRELLGVDRSGEPSGGISEHARNILGISTTPAPSILGPLLPKIGQKLTSLGITSVQEASLVPGLFDYLEAFESSGQMNFRIQTATRLEPVDYIDRATGEVDIGQMMVELEVFRDRFSASSLISATTAKIFLDGVVEGDPLTDPPTLPNAAMLQTYKQPRFSYDVESGTGSLLGYVDTDSELCQQIRANPVHYQSQEQVAAFYEANDFHPRQCDISNGVLQDSVEFAAEYARRLNDAGFTIHTHALGDRAVRLAADILEPLMEGTPGNPLRHSLAHTQIIHPDEVRRIGDLGLYLAYTYSWMAVTPPYDMTVIPFIEEVSNLEDLYDPDSYYMNSVYPVRSTMEAGAVLIAGSDAPVDDLSPRPFLNMAIGVSRTDPILDKRALNASEAIDIHQMIAAYTINGARAMKQEDITGSIEVGKRADFAVLDRNIVDLYDAGAFEEFASTQVDVTVFDGEVIYTRE